MTQKITLQFAPDEYVDLGCLAAQFKCGSVENLFQTLGAYIVEVARERMNGLTQVSDSEFHGAVN